MKGGGRVEGVAWGEREGLRSAPDFAVDPVVFVGAVDDVLEVLGELLARWWGGVAFHNVIFGLGWACGGHDKAVDSLVAGD